MNRDKLERVFHRYRVLFTNAFAPEGADTLDCLAFSLLVAFLAAAPYLYGISPPVRNAVGGGSAMPGGTLSIELLAFSAAAATFFSKSRVRPLRAPVVAAVALAGLIVLGLLQLLPLPPGALERIAPVNATIYHEAQQILRLFGRKVLFPPRVSIAPLETSATVLLVLAYGAFFLAAANLLRTRSRRRLFTGVLLSTATVQILIAVLERPLDGRLHGTFVNPDHFAGYLEIGSALALGVLWAEVLTGRDRTRGVVEGSDRFEKRFVPLAGRILLWGIIALGIAMTQSRGGILAAALMTLVFLLMAVSHRPIRFQRRAAIAMALAVVAGILFVATTAGASPLLRFLQLNPYQFGSNARVVLWRTSLRAWRQFPILGTGLGTFREAFRRVQPREFRELVEHAHSDLLQVLVTGGALGAVLSGIAVASLFVVLVRAWRKQRHREESALILAAFGALLSLILHGFVDFSLSIPSITASLACVLGAAWAARKEGTSIPLGERPY